MTVGKGVYYLNYRTGPLPGPVVDGVRQFSERRHHWTNTGVTHNTNYGSESTGA